MGSSLPLGSIGMSEEHVEPVHAYGFFSVSVHGSSLEVKQIVVFEYLDYDRHYASLSRNVERLSRELSRLAANMQAYLDQEEVVINDERVRPRVVGANIGFRGDPEEPYVIFFIHFSGRLREGLNYYENVYGEETAEYPYEIFWIFPLGAKVKEVECAGVAEVVGDNILVIKVDEGEKVTGYEKIVFVL